LKRKPEFLARWSIKSLEAIGGGSLQSGEMILCEKQYGFPSLPEDPTSQHLDWGFPATPNIAQHPSYHKKPSV